MPEEELTTIQVTKSGAAELKARYPELRNDARRLEALLGKLTVVHVSSLPDPADADRPALVEVCETCGDKKVRE